MLLDAVQERRFSFQTKRRRQQRRLIEKSTDGLQGAVVLRVTKACCMKHEQHLQDRLTSHTEMYEEEHRKCLKDDPCRKKEVGLVQSVQSLDGKVLAYMRAGTVELQVSQD